jgi:hypothetical protein
VKVINSGKLSMFFYGGTEFITTVKSFIAQASGDNVTKLFWGLYFGMGQVN